MARYEVREQASPSEFCRRMVRAPAAGRWTPSDARRQASDGEFCLDGANVLVACSGGGQSAALVRCRASPAPFAAALGSGDATTGLVPWLVAANVVMLLALVVIGCVALVRFARGARSLRLASASSGAHVRLEES